MKSLPKSKVVIEISLVDGIIEPSHEQEFLKGFQSLGTKLQNTLKLQEQLNTTVQVYLK
jgi:hypothetical protein